MCVAVLMFSPLASQAATRTWDNDAANYLWGDEVNWDGGSPGNGIPGVSDTALFGATGVGTVNLDGVTRSVNTLDVNNAGYTFANGSLSLNAVNQNNASGYLTIGVPITDAGGNGLVVNFYNAGDSARPSLNLSGQITISSTATNAFSTAGAGIGKYNGALFGSTTLANSVAGGVQIGDFGGGNSIDFNGSWTINGDFIVNRTSSGRNDVGMNTVNLMNTVSIAGNLQNATACGNSASIAIANGSAVSVGGDLIVTTKSSNYITISGQLSSLGGSARIYNGTLIINVTDPVGSGVNMTRVFVLGDTIGSADAKIEIDSNGVTLSNPVTVQNGSSGSAILTTANNINATYAGTITLNKALNINAPSSGYAITVSGKITGPQSVLINSGGQAGTVVFSNAGNDYGGGTIVSSGILQYSNAGAFAGTGRNIIVAGSGVVALGYTPGSVQNDLFNHIINTSCGAVALPASTSENISFGSAANSFASMSLGASGSVTYTGTLEPNGTTYRLGGGGGTLTFTPASYVAGYDLVINGNGMTGAVDFGGLSKSFGVITVSGGTAQNGTLTGTSIILESGTVNAILAGSGGATKNGTGTVTLSGSAVNTFAGGLTINGGTLVENLSNLASPVNLIDAGNVLTLGGTLNLTGKNGAVSSQTFASTTLTASRPSTITLTQNTATSLTLELGAITRSNGSTLNFNNPPDMVNIMATTATANDASGILGPWATVNSGSNLQYATVSGSQITTYSTATAATPADLSNVTNPNTNYYFSAGATMTGPITANTLRFTGASSTLANSGNKITLNGLLCAGSGNLTISGAGNLEIGANKELVIFFNQSFSEISANIVNNPGGASDVIITVSGEMNMSGNNAYTGGTTINGSGQMNYNNVNSYGPGPITVSGVRFYPKFAGTVTNSVTLNNIQNLGGVTWAGPMTLIGTNPMGGEGNPNITGNISGSGGINVNVNTVTLAGSNTFTGNTTVSSGTLALNNVNAIQNSTLDTVAGNVTFNVGGANIYNLGGLQGSKNLAMGGNSIIVGTNGASTVYSGVISGAGGLTKVGTGTLMLAGMNTYTGNTVIASGKLLLGASGSIANSTNITIEAGAVLDVSFRGSYTNLATQTYTFGFSKEGEGSLGRIDAAGLDISSARVFFKGLTNANDRAFILANYTNLTGSAFYSTNGLISGFSIDYHYRGNPQIALVGARSGMIILIR